VITARATGLRPSAVATRFRLFAQHTSTSALKFPRCNNSVQKLSKAIVISNCIVLVALFDAGINAVISECPQFQSAVSSDRVAFPTALSSSSSTNIEPAGSSSTRIDSRGAPIPSFECNALTRQQAHHLRTLSPNFRVMRCHRCFHVSRSIRRVRSGAETDLPRWSRTFEFLKEQKRYVGRVR
jgi:hypothetical protein